MTDNPGQFAARGRLRRLALRTFAALAAACVVACALAFASAGVAAYADDGSASASSTAAGSSAASSSSASESTGSSDSSDASNSSSSSSASSASADKEVDPFEDAAKINMKDGLYLIDVVLAGGSGKATVDSPAELEVFDGRGVVKLVWSSPYYDYMIVNGKKYFPVNESGNSEFVVPVTVYDEPMPVIGDTTAMSEAHEIEYTLTVKKDTVKDFEIAPEEDPSANEPEGIPWPWIVFIICSVLSVACIAAIVRLLMNYHSGK